MNEQYNIETLDFLENPRIFKINREDVHSDHTFYRDENKKDEFYQSLNGDWKLKYSVGIENRPKEFYKDGYDLTDFDTVQVPGHVELQGYSQIQYSNKVYPWDGLSDIKPPQIDRERTEILSYVRFFDLKPELRDKPVFISFQGVEKAFSVFLNGHFIGYAEDSFSPSDFDLTPYIKDKDNKLSVEVYKQSSSSWIEDQDFFRFSGIFRDVYLYTKPVIHVDDVWFITDFDPEDHSASIKIRLKLFNPEDLKPTINFSLKDKDKTLISEKLNLKEEDGFYYSQTFKLKDIKSWIPGEPNLYQAKLKIYADDDLTEIVPYDIGFRDIKIKDRQIQLNNEKLIINGVNRHEWNAETGRAVSKKDMNDAIEVFKDNNINAVRTSHYPNQSEWYFLCDSNGIMVMDETNLESHGSWDRRGGVDASINIPASLPEWEETVLDRVHSMFERDKNHPSIFFWSLGNESYAGENFRKMAKFLRDIDKSRLVHYEGVFWNRKFQDVSDVESRMYAYPKDIRKYLKTKNAKPFLSCEYMHDMGNSLGGMESYIKLFDEFENYHGGFIWDYMDQALLHKNSKGENVLGYGGDFGERPTDYNFSGNGIVYADGSLKPQMQEVKYWYLPKEDREAFNKKNKDGFNKAVKELKEREKREGSDLKIIKGDTYIGVSGEGFSYLFSLVDGGPVSIKFNGQEWINRAPRPAFWRAPTENDIANGFVEKSSAWMAVESFSKQKDFKILKEDKDSFKIEYEFSYPVFKAPKTTITYEAQRDGTLKVEVDYKAGKSQPEMAVFGLRFQTFKPVEEVKWTGLSGETYPDRFKGGVFGKHSEKPDKSKMLVPQEYGNHFNTIEAELILENNKSMVITMTEKPFSFSALPNTVLEIQDALHQDELSDSLRTTVSVLGEMRGVGGIDSWGADVEDDYHVLATEDHHFEFELSGN